MNFDFARVPCYRHGSPRGLIIAPLLLLTFCVWADPALVRTYDNPRDGFSLRLPEGWAPMAAETLEEANQAAVAQHPNWKGVGFRYGFRMTNAPGFTFAPYLLVRVSESGGVADPRQLQEELEMLDLPPWMQRESIVLEPELNAVVARYRTSSQGAPALESTIASFPGENRAIKLFLFAPLPEKEGPAVPVRQILRNVQIYEPVKAAPPAPASHTGLVLSFIATGTIILALSRARLSRTKAPTELHLQKDQC